MEKRIYDAQQHIDIKYIEDILLKNKGKKVICFGGGTAAEILMKKLLYRYEVYAFLDNNQELWGTGIFGIKICPPSVLEELKGDCVVLILSKHVNAIRKQLEEMGLREGKEFFDIYNKFLAYFRIKKFEGYAKAFEQFLRSIPDNLFDKIPIKSEKRIGIVCIAEMIKTVTWYPMAQCVLLRYRGYSPTLIMDHLRSFDDYIYFDGISEAARAYTEYILRLLREKCPGIEICYIDETQKAPLDHEDIKMTQTYAPVVVKWLDSRRDEVFVPEDPARIRIAEDILQGTMQSIQAFFQSHKLDTINVYTGIHRHRCVYDYIGHKYGMRVSTYDGEASGSTLYETDGVSGHSGDIPKVIEGSYFSEKEREKLLKLSEDNFKKRRYGTIEDGGYCFQTVKASRIEKKADVVIPLNISWDSAALGLDNIFENEIDWLKQTLQFIMENTDAVVMIREHPAQRLSTEFLYVNLEEELDILSEYPERILLMKADAEINTYQYMDACKVVLPYSSTAGLEAAMMGKPVIVHTNVYYKDYVYKAYDRDDYFMKIKEWLEQEAQTPDYDDRIWLVYIYQMHHGIRTHFNECVDGWMRLSLQQLNEMQGVNEIIHIIAEGIPAIYFHIKRVIE